VTRCTRRGPLPVLLAALLLAAAPAAHAASAEADPAPDAPPIRIAIAPVSGAPGLAERLAGQIERHFARARFLSGRFTVRVLAEPLALGDPDASPDVAPDPTLRRAVGDATLLIAGRPGTDGGVVLDLVHLYSLDAAYQSRQATGRAPVVPIGHRLPAPRGDDPLMTLYALQGVVYAVQGRYASALHVLTALDDFPDLAPQERFPVVFFIALSELALGVADADPARVDEALYHLGALNAVPGPAANPALAGAVLWNRGLAYQFHPTRRGPAMLDLAVASYEAALPYFPAARVPVLHARLLHQLASAEQRYPPDANGAHLFRAILAYRRALAIWTPETFPEAYRAALHNTAACLQRLPVGDREANLRTAIALYDRSLAIPALRHRRDLAAATYGNLGQAWQALTPAPDGATLWRALAAYREALRYWTAERNPGQHRRMHELAGQALTRMPAGDRRENLLRALTHFDQALSALPRDADPTGWATVQVERGVVLASLPPPGERRSLTAAREAFTAALEVITPDHLSNVHDKVVQSLERVNARLARLAGDEPPGPPKGP